MTSMVRVGVDAMSSSSSLRQTPKERSADSTTAGLLLRTSSGNPWKGNNKQWSSGAVCPRMSPAGVNGMVGILPMSPDVSSESGD